MFETLESISHQLRAGEDSFAEFKEIRLGERGVRSPNADDLAGEMVAFSHGEGGTVFLGVRDDGSVAGIDGESVPRVEQWVVNVATGNCDPPLRPTLRSVALDVDGESKHVLLVQVPKALYASRTQSGRWYVRVGSQKRDLTQAELSRLFQERGRTFVFDETLVPGAGFDDLDRRVLEAQLHGPGNLSWEQLMLNLRVLGRDDQGELRPTVAGLLSFAAEPQAFLPHAAIHAAVFRGDQRHSDDLVHSDEIVGRVADQIDDAVAFVDRFMLKPARKDVGRRDFPQYALGAVTEAIVNAVAHRDYAVSGSRIRLFLYGDRLEVISPGGLPNTITLDSLRYRQFTRNQLLVSFLSRMFSRRTNTRFIESRGEGIGRILDESAEHSGKLPVYELHGTELYLTIFAAPSPHGEGVG